LKKSAAKNFCYAETWAPARTTPKVQIQKSLFASFSSEKEALALLSLDNILYRFPAVSSFWFAPGVPGFSLEKEHSFNRP
jgi:hypothetical protein